MTSTRSASTSNSKGQSKGPHSGRLSDISRGKMSTDEKLDNIYVILSTLKEDIHSQMIILREDIKKENRELVERLESRVFDLEEQNDDLKQTVSKLEQHLGESEDRQCEQDNKLNDLEQHGRKNTIRIVGLEDSNKNETVEECVEKIVKFVYDKLNVTIVEADIDIAHRLGVYQRGKPRNIICKFTHRRRKFEIIKQRKLLKGTRCYIMEDLTRINQQRLKEAFELRCVERSWSTDGKLFVLLKNGRKRRILNTTRS
ncbi:uncharacterized protein LOC110462821 [Mizuhopecten yessoensis]|uniref:uncharacterized protein LOC110462821 n=1 Tax=Mizuhopecten yessoensis TaxID=6573 RepID=UPI000B45F895|nr:uncharacterized protein LOC110462821 [Mizuhopecten yessoensis]